MNKIITLVIIFSLLSCYEEIDLPTPRGQEETNVVIQGEFNKGEIESTIKVYFSKTAGKQSFSELIRVSSVVVENDLGQKLKLDEDDDGGYSAKVKHFDNAFSTAEGRKIRLTALDYASNLIQSTFQAIAIGPSFDSLWYQVVNKPIIGLNNIIEEGEFIEIFGQLNKSRDIAVNYFYNDFEHHYKIIEQIENLPVTQICYVEEKIARPFAQFNANEVNTIGALNFPIVSIQTNNTYSDDSYLTIKLNSINEEAYTYRSHLTTLVENKNTIFSNPKDRLVSNFIVVDKPNIDVYGYFTVSTQSIKRVKLFSKDFKKIKKDCPSELDEIGNCVRRQCCNCLIVKGAGLEKPYFWN